MSAIIGNATFGHEDNRRRIDEFDSPEGGFSIQLFTVYSNDPLGDHYHAGKDEIFVVIEGYGEVMLADVDKDGKIGEIKTRHIYPGSVVKVKPRTAHTFTFDVPESRMICYSTAPFDRDDLHKCVLS